MKKSNLGALVILAGIGVIGFIWFKRNKPTTANTQLAELTAQSNALNTGSTGEIDKAFEYTEEQKQNAGKNPYTYGFYSDKEVKNWYKDMTPAELEALKKSIGNIPDPSAIASNQIAVNMQSADFSNLGNIGFTNIKI
jgi:predicted nuclease of restriction endonuclease-like (RecB) superfamily